METKEREAKENKKAYVLIKVKPKYTEEFCIMMVACKEACNRAPVSENLAEIEKVLSVLGPFDFLLVLSSEGKNEEKINKTVSKIREILGSYINETITLTKFDIMSAYKKIDKEKYEQYDKVLNKLDEIKKLENNEIRKKDMNKAFDDFEERLEEYKLLEEYLFNIDAKFEAELNNGSVSEDLKDEFKTKEFSVTKENENKGMIAPGEKTYIVRKEDEKLKVYRERGDLGSTFNDLKCFKDLIEKEAKNNDKTETEVSVLMRIKTKYIAEYYILMKLFEALCGSESRKFAKIKDVLPVFGPYDFLWRIRAKGESEEESNNKINGTILKIREIFNSCIDETVTLMEFELTMTKEELKNFFKKFLGVETIAKKGVGQIPDESNNNKISLKKISNAEITPLKNLLKEAKKSFEPEYLKKEIDNLTERIEELEKKMR